jgi:hypothetical protein
MFTIFALVAFAGINMGLKQGQANPDANGFLDSKASAVK